MTSATLPTKAREREREAPVAADVELLKRELMRALGSERRPSMREVTEAYRRGVRTVLELGEKRLLEERAVEVLTRSLTTLFVQAVMLGVTDSLFERHTPASAMRRWLEESLP